MPAKGSVPDHEYQLALKKRKQFNDQECYKRAKATGSKILTDSGVAFTGVCDDTLRTMSRVKAFRLSPGHTFPNKDILLLRIAEEANLCSLYLTQYRNDHFSLIVYSDRFFVGASFIKDILLLASSTEHHEKIRKQGRNRTTVSELDVQRVVKL